MTSSVSGKPSFDAPWRCGEAVDWRLARGLAALSMAKRLGRPRRSAEKVAPGVVALEWIGFAALCAANALAVAIHGLSNPMAALCGAILGAVEFVAGVGVCGAFMVGVELGRQVEGARLALAWRGAVEAAEGRAGWARLRDRFPINEGWSSAHHLAAASRALDAASAAEAGAEWPRRAWLLSKLCLRARLAALWATPAGREALRAVDRWEAAAEADEAITSEAAPALGALAQASEIESSLGALGAPTSRGPSRL